MQRLQKSQNLQRLEAAFHQARFHQTTAWTETTPRDSTTSMFGKNDYARDMYEDMMYDNYAESLTKNSHFGLADQIYIELSGQRG